WNDGVSYPIQSGHGCLGCSEQGFWDHGSFYDRVTNISPYGTDTTAETVGGVVLGGIATVAAAHAVISTGVHLKRRHEDTVAAAAEKQAKEELLRQKSERKES
ncbi:MAG: hypothetical protein RRY20_09125, partial [Bilophila sp.]